jgi:hypothetical protein
MLPCAISCRIRVPRSVDFSCPGPTDGVHVVELRIPDAERDPSVSKGCPALWDPHDFHSDRQ